MTRKPVLKKGAADAEVAEAGAPSVAAEDWWDDQKEQALDLVLQGLSKSAIARQLGVHRNTINNWCAHPKFIAEGNQRLREHVSAKRQRRMVETNLFGDRLARLAAHQVEKLEEDMKQNRALGGDDLRRMRELMFEYRAFREEERKDFGDDVKRVSVTSTNTTSITGDVNVRHTVAATPFGEFVKQAMDEGAIDAEAIESADGESKGKQILELAERVLTDTTLLDALQDEENAERAGVEE